MNKNIVNWAMIIVVVATAFFGIKYYYASKAFRNNQSLIAEGNRVQSTQVMANSLFTDTLEYSKTHPAIDPVLEAAGIKPGKAPAAPAPATTPKPAAK